MRPKLTADFGSIILFAYEGAVVKGFSHDGEAEDRRAK